MCSIVELGDVAGAVEVLAKVDWVDLPGDVIGEALVDLSRLRARLDAVEAAATGAFHRSQAWTVDGSKSSGAWLAYRTRSPKGDHDRCRHRSRTLQHLPVAEAAFEAGEITARHVDVLGWAQASRPDQFAAAEAFLVSKAMELPWRSFRIALRHWVNIVDPAATNADRRDHTGQRHLHASRSLNGMGRIDGWLEPLAFETFNTALERIEQELFDDDWTHARQRHGEQANVTHLARTPTQRRADALVEMAQRAATAPTNGKRPLPLVNIVCDWHTFQTELAKLTSTDPQPVDDGTCRLLDGEPITPTDMFHQALLGEVRRIVFDNPGVTIDMGRKARLYTGNARHAILVHHQTCAHPTCDLPATKCEIDHIKPWLNGGQTTQTNGQPLCDHHNRWKARHGP